MIDAIDILKGVGPRGGQLDAHHTPVARVEPYNGTDSRLHVFVDTATNGIQDEKPWHAMAAVMMMAGRKNEEIAKAAGVTAVHVTHLRAQRWFQEKLAMLAKEQGEEVLAVLRAEALASVNVLVELRDEVGEAPSVQRDRLRAECARTIIEHAHGKPTQRVVSVTAHTAFDSPQAEMEDVLENLQLVRQIRSSNPT